MATSCSKADCASTARSIGNIAVADGKAGTLVVSESARVDGRIEVTHVVINGTVNGPVVAKDYLELQPKARIVGDVCYRTVEMHIGAVDRGPARARAEGEPGYGRGGRTQAGGRETRSTAGVTLRPAQFDGLAAETR